jgi:hypothetical protein
MSQDERNIGPTKPEEPQQGGGTPSPDSKAQAGQLGQQQGGQGQQGEAQKPLPPPPPPNVILKRKPGPDGEPVRPLTVDGPVNMGVVTINLPGAEAQRDGFYLEPKLAALLLTQFPHIYATKLYLGPTEGQQQGEGQNGDETK